MNAHKGLSYVVAVSVQSLWDVFLAELIRFFYRFNIPKLAPRMRAAGP
jgi:hypothetical protein